MEASKQATKTPGGGNRATSANARCRSDSSLWLLLNLHCSPRYITPGHILSSLVLVRRRTNAGGKPGPKRWDLVVG